MKEKLIRFMQGRYGVDQFYQISYGSGAGLYDSFPFYKKHGMVIFNSAASGLLLFPHVFQKYHQKICRKSEIPADDSRYPEKMGLLSKGYERSENASYIQMSRMQTENQSSQGKRKNSDPMPEVPYGIY